VFDVEISCTSTHLPSSAVLLMLCRSVQLSIEAPGPCSEISAAEKSVQSGQPKDMH
jgi:hypothetical protein